MGGLRHVRVREGARVATSGGPSPQVAPYLSLPYKLRLEHESQISFSRAEQTCVREPQGVEHGVEMIQIQHTRMRVRGARMMNEVSAHIE